MDVRDPDPIPHAAGEAPYSEPYVEKVVSKTMTGPAEAIAEQQALEELTRQRTDPNNYPEGGLAAWLVVLGSLCGTTSCFGLMNTIGVLHTYVSMDILRMYSDGTVGWIFSLYLFISMAGGVFCGPVFDLYGPRWMVLIGSILLVAGVMLTSFATRKFSSAQSNSTPSLTATSLQITGTLFFPLASSPASAPPLSSRHHLPPRATGSSAAAAWPPASQPPAGPLAAPCSR